MPLATGQAGRVGGHKEIKLPSTGSHRLDWCLMVALAIIRAIIFVSVALQVGAI